MSDRDEHLVSAALADAVAGLTLDTSRLAEHAKAVGGARRRRRRAVRAIGAAVALALVGWVAVSLPARLAGPGPVTSTRGASPLRYSANGELLLACNGWPDVFPVGQVTTGMLGVDRAQFLPALREGLATMGIDAPEPLRTAPDLDAVAFRVLTQDERHAMLAFGRDGRIDTVVNLVRVDGRWRIVGHSGCALGPALEPGVTWVSMSLSQAGRGGPPAVPSPGQATGQVPPTDTTEVPVWVSERGCLSGRDPRPYLREPLVDETPDAVTVFWTSGDRPSEGSCPDNPSVPATLHLRAPLGTRQLLDGSTWPPRELTLR